MLFGKVTAAVLVILNELLVVTTGGKALTLGVTTDGIPVGIVADGDAKTAVACAGFEVNASVGKLTLDTMDADERFRDERDKVPFPESEPEFVDVGISIPFLKL